MLLAELEFQVLLVVPGVLARLTVLEVRGVLVSLEERRCLDGQGFQPLRALLGVLVGLEDLVGPVGRVCMEVEWLERKERAAVCRGFRGFLALRAFLVCRAFQGVPGVLADRASSSPRSSVGCSQRDRNCQFDVWFC